MLANVLKELLASGVKVRVSEDAGGLVLQCDDLDSHAPEAALPRIATTRRTRSVTAAIHELLARNPEGLSRSDIANAVGSSLAYIDQKLGHGVASGEFQRVASGTYTLANKASASPEAAAASA